MTEGLIHGLGLVAKILEIAGAASLILGFVIATFHCIRRYFREGRKPTIAIYRKSLGSVVIFGLEIMVAATIIKTITLEPTAEAMALLVIIVAIRTALGWTMSLEINGRWPWQKE